MRDVTLPDGRRLVVRRTTIADVDAVMALYERLSSEDLRRRFFTAHPPPRDLIEEWTSSDRGGAALVVEAYDDHDGPLVVAEAGYSLLPDGDGELAITVDPAWRGWLGTFLLDALVEVAAEHGVPNLHADMLLLNRPMVSLMRRRGSATVDHPDLGEVRLVIATDGGTPGWAPKRMRPRLLVEGVKGMWWGEQLARQAGFELRMCPGPGGVAENCPVMRGEPCPMVDGADVVVSMLPDDDLTEEILERHRCTHPGLTIVVPGDEFDVGEGVGDLFDELRAAVPERDDPASI